ncbi:MAG: hypothetical protein M3P18_19155, partial [Actinomycetota bacterium]|nr:hypothetical protein [Actinomycetota bacterium]
VLQTFALPAAKCAPGVRRCFGRTGPGTSGASFAEAEPTAKADAQTATHTSHTPRCADRTESNARLITGLYFGLAGSGTVARNVAHSSTAALPVSQR